MKRTYTLSDSSIKKKVASIDDGRHREINTVLVQNLPKSYNQTKIKKLFRECGSINELNVVDCADKNGRMARIEFANHAEVLAALSRSGKYVGETSQELQVTVLSNSTVWITNFPPEYTVKELRQLIIDTESVPLSIRLPSLRFNQNRRFAYIDVTSNKEAQKVVDRLNGKQIGIFNLVAKLSNPLEKEGRSDAAVLEKREIIVKNLKLSMLNEETIRSTFSKFGEIESIKIPKSSSESNSYAFVTFRKKEAATESIKLHKTEIDDQIIYVKLADKKAYIARQEVKRILNARHLKNYDSIISLYPITDKISKVQIQELLQDKMLISDSEINELYLVSDHEAAIVIFKTAAMAAKCILTLNGTQYYKKILHAGYLSELRRDFNSKPKNINTNLVITKKETPTDDQESFDDNNSSNPDKAPKKQMNNEDFRKMFLGL